MFESAELGHCLSKADFQNALPELRQQLLEAQRLLLGQKAFPVILLVAGVDGAGKSATVNALNAWMDPRHIQTHAFAEPSDEELERPHMWRYWRALPPKGQIAIFDGSWYTWPIFQRVYGRIKDDRLDHDLEQVRAFEQMLIDEGALVLKFWMHLSKKAQKKRLESLEKDAKTRWRVTKRDWEHFERYDTFREVSERALRHTNLPEAPWFVVEAADHRFQLLTVGRTVLEQLKERLEHPEPVGREVRLAPHPASVDDLNVLRNLDLSGKLDDKTYEGRLEELQGRLNLLTRHKRFKKHSAVLVFEGMDAAGKGGSIRRITQAIDARLYSIHPVAAPTEEERAQPYLWRFWRHLPRRGRFAIFDRSWYGRVLVERVEGFCSEGDWRRAFGEINAFEEQLTASGCLVVKFWLTISQEEQLRRFQERQVTPFKQFKITDEDWRNREKWPQYEAAVCDMLAHTSSNACPWTLVASEDKRFGRIQILETLCERLENLLKR